MDELRGVNVPLSKEDWEYYQKRIERSEIIKRMNIRAEKGRFEEKKCWIVCVSFTRKIVFNLINKVAKQIPYSDDRFNTKIDRFVKSMTIDDQVLKLDFFLPKIDEINPIKDKIDKIDPILGFANVCPITLFLFDNMYGDVNEFEKVFIRWSVVLPRHFFGIIQINHLESKESNSDLIKDLKKNRKDCGFYELNHHDPDMFEQILGKIINKYKANLLGKSLYYSTDPKHQDHVFDVFEF